jgi:predicted dehydrogenase
VPGWGIAGTGQIAGRFALALRDLPGARLVRVASRDAERAGSFAAAHVGAVPGTWPELLADPAVEVVYVASPHSAHCEQAVEALAAGKHVLVEKPMALSLEQVRRMVDTASEHDRFLMEAMWTRFLPSYRRLRELVAQDAIGRVVSVEAELGFAAPFDPEHRLYRRDLGGGALLDIGTYPLQLALLLLGRPTEVRATAVLGPTEVDHDTTVELVFDGATAHLRCSIAADLPGTSSVVGERGRIELAAPVWAPESLVVDGARYDLPVVGNGLGHQAAEVHRCLLAGELQSPGMSWDDSLLLAETLDRVRSLIGLSFPVDDGAG